MQIKSEQITQSYKGELEQSIVLAFERVNILPENVISIANDVRLAFPKYTTDELTTAIRKGSFGEFGRTYRMSTQEICIWVREHVGYKPDFDKIKEYSKLKGL